MMEKTTRRRRQNEEIYGRYDDEARTRPRENHLPKNERFQYGRSDESEYENAPRPMRNEMTWDDGYYDRPEWEKVGTGSGRSAKERYKTHGRDQHESEKWRHLIREEDETSRYKPRHDPYYEERRQQLRRYRGIENNYYDNLADERYWQDLYSRDPELFGEHPASAGREEYRGVNKRHAGLHGKSSRYRRSNADRYAENDNAFIYNENEAREYRGYRNKERSHDGGTRQAIRNYENRGQFETPFHAMQMYDPIESEYKRERIAKNRGDDHIYRYEGYQHAGNTEGFGRGEGRGQEYDWLDEDEYREGHVPRQRGYRKYVSR